MCGKTAGVDHLDVADWRRRISSLYAAVRAEPDPPTAHLLWRHGRDDLLCRHPASPIPTSERDGYGGADVAAYDRAYRFVVTVEPLEPVIRTVEAGDDPAVDLLRIGYVNLPGLGTLDVWWLQAYGGGIFLPVRDRATTSYQGGRYIFTGSDLAARAGAAGFIPKGDLIWYQAGTRLRPYGYPRAFVPNIVHQHILVLRNEPARQSSRRRDSR